MDFIFQEKPLEVYEEFIIQINHLYNELRNSNDLNQQLQSIEAEFFQQNVPEIQIHKLFLIVFVNFQKTQDESQINRSVCQFFECRHQRIEVVVKFFLKVFQNFDIIPKDHHIVFIVIFEHFIPLIEHDNCFYFLINDFLTYCLSYQSEFCYSQKIWNLLYNKIYLNSSVKLTIKNLIAAKLFQIVLLHCIQDKEFQNVKTFQEIFDNQQSIDYFRSLGTESFFFFKLIQDKIEFTKLYQNLTEVTANQSQKECLDFYKLVVPIKVQKFVVFLFQNATPESFGYQMIWFQNQIQESIINFDLYFYVFLIRYIYYESLYSVTNSTAIHPWVLAMQIVQIASLNESKNLYSLVKEAIFLDWLFFEHSFDYQKHLIKIGFDVIIHCNQSMQQQSNQLLEFIFLYMQQYDQTEKLVDVFVYLDYLNYNLFAIFEHLTIDEQLKTELLKIQENIQQRQQFLKKEDIFEDQKIEQENGFEEESFEDSLDQSPNEIENVVVSFYQSQKNMSSFVTSQEFLNFVTNEKVLNQNLISVQKIIQDCFNEITEFKIQQIQNLTIYRLYQLNIQLSKIEKASQKKFTQNLKILLKDKKVFFIAFLIFVFNYKFEKEKQINSLQKTIIKANKKLIDQTFVDQLINYVIQNIDKINHLKFGIIILKVIKNFGLKHYYFYLISFCYESSKYSQDFNDIEEMSFYFVKKFDELDFQENKFKFKIFILVLFETDMIFPHDNFDVLLNKIIEYQNDNPSFLQENCLLFIRILSYVKKNLTFTIQQECIKYLFDLKQQNFWFFKIISKIFEKNEIIHLIKSKTKSLKKDEKKIFLEYLEYNIKFTQEEKELLLLETS